MNETEIIKGCLKNDLVSQKALYDLFYGKMLAVCLRYAKDSDEAKDIFKDAFIKASKTIRNVNNSTSLELWLKKIMVNTAINHLRKNRQDYLIVSTVYANEKQNNVPLEISDEELALVAKKEEILLAIQELTPAYRTVYNMFEVDDYSLHDISEMLDISESTSKSNLSKAKFNLRKNLWNIIKKRNVN